MQCGKKALIIITFVLYLVHLGFQTLAARGGSHSQFFPRSPQNVSETFKLEITPVGKTFAIWGVIFLLQLIWLIYSVTTVFRSSPSANILSTGFYLAFNANIAMITTWLFTWARELGEISFAVTVAGQLFIVVAIGYSFKDLKSFLDESKGAAIGTKDVWCQRILVQNGLLFYATWTTVATLLNFAIVLAYYMGVQTKV